MFKIATATAEEILNNGNKMPLNPINFLNGDFESKTEALESLQNDFETLQYKYSIGTIGISFADVIYDAIVYSESDALENEYFLVIENPKITAKQFFKSIYQEIRKNSNLKFSLINPYYRTAAMLAWEFIHYPNAFTIYPLAWRLEAFKKAPNTYRKSTMCQCALGIIQHHK